MKIDINLLDLIVLDFDGVLTDNRVYIDNNGTETISCNRSDGLAFDILEKKKKKFIILSSEKNKVVIQRGKKLGIKVYSGIKYKHIKLQKIFKLKKYDKNKCLYIGNDINDFKAMTLCKYKLCPSDSHKEIKKISNLVLKSKGGHGVIRELVEKIFKISIESYLR